jgi:hypothetical protein
MGLGDGPHDGEAKPCPPAGRARGDEAPEKVGANVFGDRARIDDADRDALTVSLDDDARRPVGVAVHDGVVDEVFEGPR